MSENNAVNFRSNSGSQGTMNIFTSNPTPIKQEARIISNYQDLYRASTIEIKHDLSEQKVETSEINEQNLNGQKIEANEKKELTGAEDWRMMTSQGGNEAGWQPINDEKKEIELTTGDEKSSWQPESEGEDMAVLSNNDGNNWQNEAENQEKTIVDEKKNEESVEYFEPKEEGVRDKLVMIIFIATVVLLIVALALFAGKVLIRRSNDQWKIDSESELEIITSSGGGMNESNEWGTEGENEVWRDEAGNEIEVVVETNGKEVVGNQNEGVTTGATDVNGNTDVNADQKKESETNNSKGGIAEGGKSGQNGETTYLRGVVYFSGKIPNGASVLVLQRRAGEKGDFQQVAKIPASDGSIWKWEGAEAGVKYEVVYNLVGVNGEGIRKSQTAIAGAPSHVNIKMFTGTE